VTAKTLRQTWRIGNDGLCNAVRVEDIVAIVGDTAALCGIVVRGQLADIRVHHGQSLDGWLTPRFALN
jgi:hypothetical protein